MTAPGCGGDPSRYPSLYLVNPWTPQDEVEKALLYRGAILAAWGLIETSISEIAIRCSCTDAYSGLRDKFPYSIGERVSYLARVLEAPGPLSPYASFGLQFLKRFERSKSLRNTMAHSRMTLLPHWGCEFQEIGVRAGGSLTLKRRRFQISELAAEARRPHA